MKGDLLCDDGTMVRIVEADPVESIDVGGGKTVHLYADGHRSFEHVCDRAHRNAGRLICAPTLQHTIISVDPLTITPSILCTDCGTHGFVTNGVWTE